MNRYIAGTFGLTLIAAAACAAPQEAAVDIQAETAALRAAAQAYDDALMALDADALAAFYMEDAVAYPPNEPTVEGAAGFREYAMNFLSVPGIEVSLGQTQVVVGTGGDLGYTYAEGEVTFEGPDGESITEMLRDFHVWAKNADGEWRLAVDIWNSPEPLAEGDG